MTLPHVELGNTFQDIGQGANSFAQGLMAERARQQQIALQEALAAARTAAATKAQRPFNITSVDANGNLVHALEDLSGNTTLASGPGANAPSSQIVFPTQDAHSNVPGYATVPRYVPGQSAQKLPLPPGQVGRMEPPQIREVETGQGPGFAGIQPRTGATEIIGGGNGGNGTGQGGNTLAPRAQQFEVEKAQFAANMSRAARAMEHASPAAVQRVVGRQNIAQFLTYLPVIGAPAGEAARNLMAVGLTPEEATWLANFNTFLGFAVPELAGKQMTITEMRMQAAMFAPLLDEPEESKMIKRGNVRFRVQSAISASGSGWKRLMNDPTVAGEIPQEYGGLLQEPAEPVTTKPNKYNYTPRN